MRDRSGLLVGMNLDRSARMIEKCRLFEASVPGVSTDRKSSTSEGALECALNNN